jgi:hypothetical protein
VLSIEHESFTVVVRILADLIGVLSCRCSFKQFTAGVIFGSRRVHRAQLAVMDPGGNHPGLSPGLCATRPASSNPQIVTQE